MPLRFLSSSSGSGSAYRSLVTCSDATIFPAGAIWVIVLIVAPYIGVLAYLIFQGRGMGERNLQQAQAAREELRREIGFSAADEIEKLDRLKKAGSISDAEFARLRAKLVQ